MYQLTNLYLENGLKVVLHRIPTSKTIACGVWVKQGSRYENDETSGLSHLLEHLIVTSNNGEESHNMIDCLEDHGIVYNATTTKEYTSYYLSGVSDTLEICIETLSELLTTYKPVSEEVFENEKKIVIREAIGYYGAFKQISERSTQALWGNNDVGRIIVGDINVLQKVSQDTIKDLYHTSYTPENATLVAVGGFEVDEIVAYIEKYFSIWKDTPSSRKTYLVNKEPGMYVNTKSGGENAMLSICFKLPEFAHSYRNTIEVISLVLGDSGIKSRLAREIRMKRGLAYIINSFESFYEDRGILGFASVCAPQKVQEVAEIMMQEFSLARQEGFLDTEIEAAKRKLITKRLLSLENVSDHLKYLGKCAVYGTMFSVEQEIRNIKKINQDLIKEVLGTIFVDNNMACAAIGDIEIDSLVEKIRFR